MTQPFINGAFLLSTRAAERLYFEHARDMPILDYHSHLPVRQIVDDAKFDNMTRIWLYGDHYKWRAMRACGCPEELVSGIPGRADDYARFEAWAGTVPQTLGNPLYHWTHLELKRYFGIDDLLSPATARSIYDRCGEMLASPDFSARSLIRRSNVRALCTTDDPTDDLGGHAALASEDWGAKAFPAWRPDKALAADDATAFNAWLDRLEAASGGNIAGYRDLMDALRERHAHFHAHGCRISDYGIERPYAAACTDKQAADAFAKARSGAPLAGDVLERYRSAVLHDLLAMDAESGWAQQLHLGAKRNNRTEACRLRGPDTGYDCMGEFPVCDDLVALLDRLDREGRLAKTVVYHLNPIYDDLLASVVGSFQGGVPGGMQLGAAWWHNDHKAGMLKQMTALASIGLLSRFVGMLTDSRSFLSYPRHEYFRRILCRMLGEWMEEGEIPGDFDLVGTMVRNICYNNAEAYFQLNIGLLHNEGLS